LNNNYRTAFSARFKASFYLFIFLKKNAEGFVLKWKKNSCHFFSRIFFVVFPPKKIQRKTRKNWGT